MIALAASALLLLAVPPEPGKTPTPRPAASSRSVPGGVLAEIDRQIRENFWDAGLKGVDWTGAVDRASAALKAARTPADRDAVYDRLLATLDDSHTFRVPAGRLPEARWSTSGLRIGRDGGGYAVKGVLPGGVAERAGMKTGDRVLSIAGRALGSEKSNFRDQFLALEGQPGTTISIVWKAGEGDTKTSLLALEPEPPGDTLVWRSARVIRREGKAWGYVRLWGMSAETALAVVDLLSDRTEAALAKTGLEGLDAIEGVLLDIRGNSGGYEPNILPTFLRGRWSAGDYWVDVRGRRRLSPPEYRPLPVALLINSATASAGEALALKFRRHAIGPIVGEETAGMLSGGANFARLSDGSSLWFSSRAVEDESGKEWEGRPVAPDVLVPDRPPAAAGQEDGIVEAAIRTLRERAAAGSR